MPTQRHGLVKQVASVESVGLVGSVGSVGTEGLSAHSQSLSMRMALHLPTIKAMSSRFHLRTASLWTNGPAKLQWALRIFDELTSKMYSATMRARFRSEVKGLCNRMIRRSESTLYHFYLLRIFKSCKIGVAIFVDLWCVNSSCGAIITRETAYSVPRMRTMCGGSRRCLKNR